MADPAQQETAMSEFLSPVPPEIEEARRLAASGQGDPEALKAASKTYNDWVAANRKPPPSPSDYGKPSPGAVFNVPRTDVKFDSPEGLNPLFHPSAKTAQTVAQILGGEVLPSSTISGGPYSWQAPGYIRLANGELVPSGIAADTLRRFQTEYEREARNYDLNARDNQNILDNPLWQAPIDPYTRLREKYGVMDVTGTGGNAQRYLPGTTYGPTPDMVYPSGGAGRSQPVGSPGGVSPGGGGPSGDFPVSGQDPNRTDGDWDPWGRWDGGRGRGGGSRRP